MAVNNNVPELPEHVIHEVLRRLPTKTAVAMSLLSQQWEGLLASVPTVDFDEGGDDNKIQRHYKFINILKRCLLSCKKEKQTQALDEFRLHMRSYLCRDAITVTNWLSYAFERSVKEVDLSLRVSKWQPWDRGWRKNCYCYYLSMTDFVNARSITRLNLEHVRLQKNHRSSLEPAHNRRRLLPSLKNMSLKNAYLERDALSCLLEECPALELLSLLSCFFPGTEINVSVSSLKSLEIKHCKASLALVHQASNLESVIIDSTKYPFEALESVVLIECYNLKCVNVYGNRRMNMFHVHGCRDVKGTIHAPNLDYFSYEGYLKSTFSLKAPKLTMARIILWDIFDRPLEHFPKLKGLLKEFGSSKEMILVVLDFKALIFPKDFRRTLPSSILPDVQVLEYGTVAPAIGRDGEELMQSLQWMAPLANISQLEYNAELNMYAKFEANEFED